MEDGATCREAREVMPLGGAVVVAPKRLVGDEPAAGHGEGQIRKVADRAAQGTASVGQLRGVGPVVAAEGRVALKRGVANGGPARVVEAAPEPQAAVGD